MEPFIDLARLRSWTTVGTPFLHHLPRRQFLTTGWPHPRFSLNPERQDMERSRIVDSLLVLMAVAPIFYLVGVPFFKPLRETPGNAAY